MVIHKCTSVIDMGLTVRSKEVIVIKSLNHYELMNARQKAFALKNVNLCVLFNDKEHALCVMILFKFTLKYIHFMFTFVDALDTID